MKKTFLFLFIALCIAIVMPFCKQSNAYAIINPNADKEIDVSQTINYEGDTKIYNTPFSVTDNLSPNETLSIKGATQKKAILFSSTDNSFQNAGILQPTSIAEDNFYVIEGLIDSSTGEDEKVFVYLDYNNNEYYLILQVTYSSNEGYYYQIEGTNYYICLDPESGHYNKIGTYDVDFGGFLPNMEDAKFDLGNGSYYFKIEYEGVVYHCQSISTGSKEADSNTIAFDYDGTVISIFDVYQKEYSVDNSIKRVTYNNQTIYQLYLSSTFSNGSVVFDVYNGGVSSGTFTLNITKYEEPKELIPPTIEYKETIEEYYDDNDEKIPVIRLSYDEYLLYQNGTALEEYLSEFLIIDSGEYDVVQIYDGHTATNANIECSITGLVSGAGANSVNARFEYTPRNANGFIGYEQDDGTMYYSKKMVETKFILAIDRPYTSITVHRTDSEGNIIDNEPVDVEDNEQSEEIYFIAVDNNGNRLSKQDFNFNTYDYNETTGVFSSTFKATTTIQLTIDNSGYSNYPTLDNGATIEPITITINTVHLKAPEIVLNNNIQPIVLRRKDVSIDNIASQVVKMIRIINDPYSGTINTSAIEYYTIIDSREISLTDFISQKPNSGTYTIYAKVKNQYNNYSNPVTFDLTINVQQPTYTNVFKNVNGDIAEGNFEYGTQRLSIEIAFSNTDDYDSFEFDFITDERYISYSESFDNATQKLTINLTLSSGLVGVQECNLIVYGIINEEKSTVYNEPISLNFQLSPKPNKAPVIVFTQTTVDNNYTINVIKNSYTNLLSYIESVSDDYDTLSIDDIDITIDGIPYSYVGNNYRFEKAGQIVVAYTLIDSKLLTTSQNIVFNVQDTKPTSEDKTFEFSYKENKIISLEDITDQDGDAVYIQFYSKNSTGKWEETYIVRDDKGDRIGAISDNGNNVFAIVTDNVNYVGVLTLKFLPYNLGDTKNVDNAYNCTINIIDNVAPTITTNEYIDHYYQGQVSKEDISLNDIVTAQDEVDGLITPTITGSVNPNVAGTYNIHYVFVDKANNKAEETISIRILPVEKPTIELVRENFEIKKGEEFNVYDIIYQIVDNDKIYQDNFDKLTNLNINYSPALDINKPGEYKIYISYTGQFNNVSEVKEFTLTIKEPPNYTLIIVLSVLGAGAIVGGVFLIRFIVFKRRSRI